ncbi:BTAD domain-containing putative transcriptional regulator [Streptomyces triticirhizae]|uniref:AfsR family transcriptional regulator n=1 Tax=Streptomyces triticirhizae TaxID=2483353 RepID=A0A3M2KVQ1_9ACTN|nr:BTAD domain-containing putative transcriptional regulator [Streptomyces triticirhizae]RMI28756.1 AfsR family transcriptional regulator [Streptomyces triticirhizae]
MEFLVLGPLEVRGSGGPPGVAGRLRRALLGVLLARAGQVVPADVLVDALWGERADERAGQRLHLQVHRLRGFLDGPERLSRVENGYRLRVDEGELDAERFESLVARAVGLVEREPARAVETLRAALALWRGAPFADSDVPELCAWADRLAERRLVAWETLYRAELACGAGAELVDGLEELARAHPLRERLTELLVTALHRAGRRDEALAAYRRARRCLADELGLEPGAELREVVARVRSGAAPPDRLAAASPEPAPNQLPADIGGFVGRGAELAELDARVSAPVPVLITAVAGTAGVGKTALAVRWAHRARERFPDGQLYVDLRGYGPDQPRAPEDVLAGFLRALGMAGSAIPHELDERAARFRTLVDGRRMLLLLDNAADVAQVRPLLPGSPSCVTLVTSRDTLTGLVVREGARRVALDRFSAVEARELLRSLLGEERLATEPAAAVDALVERCARLPLALRIAAELVRSHRGPGGVAALAGSLAGRRGALDLLDVDDPQTAVRAVFSWSYQRLAPDEALVFRMVGAHPGPDLEEHAVAALAGLERRAARRALDALVRGHLVERSPSGRYGLHDLLHAYATELDGPADERMAALGRLSDYYLSTASAAMDVLVPQETFRRPPAPDWPGEAPRFDSPESARDWLDAERANLLALARISGPRRTLDLAETLWRYLFLGGFPDEALHLYTRELSAARALGDPLAEARARNNLGKTMDQLGLDGEAALDHLRAALAAYERAGLPEWQSAVRNNLGVAHGRRGELDAAVAEFEASLALVSPDGPWPLRRAPMVNVSRCLKEMGRPDEALGILARVLELCREHEDLIHIPNALTGLADLSLLTGREAEARAHAVDGLALAREHGFRAVEVDCLRVLGVVARSADQPAEAVRRHEEALAVARSIGSRHTLLEALDELAASQAAAGDLARALATRREALDVATEAGHRAGAAAAHAALAALHARRGETEAARAHGRDAVGGHEALGQRTEADEVRSALADLAGREGLGERAFAGRVGRSEGRPFPTVRRG